jgi:hypothetical protein
MYRYNEDFVHRAAADSQSVGGLNKLRIQLLTHKLERRPVSTLEP